MRKFILLLPLVGLLLASCVSGDSARATEIPEGSAASTSAGDAGSSSQTNTAAGNLTYTEHIRFEQIGVEDGLSQSAVNAILQDQKGFLWFGTEDGLNRYDGYTFNIFKPDADDPNSLGDRWITALAEDPNGNIWIATRAGGLSRHNPVTGKMTRFIWDDQNENGIVSNKATALAADADGIWIGTENGLDFLEYDSQTFKHYSAEEDSESSLSSSSISALFIDSSGALWIGTSNAGLNLYNRDSDSFKIFKSDEDDANTIGSNRVFSIAQGTDGDIWVGTSNGASRYSPQTKEFLRYTHSGRSSESIASDTVFAIYRDRSGGLWFGTDEGLDRYDPSSRKFIHHNRQSNSSLSSNVMRIMYEDRSGVIWAGTPNGLNKYNRQQDRYTYYNHNPADANSLSGNDVQSIAVDQSRFIWIGTSDAGLSRLNPVNGEFARFKHNASDAQSLSSDNVQALYVDINNVLWTGTDQGLDRYNYSTRTFAHFTIQSSNQSVLSVYSIYQDANNALWVGTSRGVYLFDERTQTLARFQIIGESPHAIENARITSFMEDSDGNLWIGSFDGGVSRINPQRSGVVQYRHDPDTPSTLGSDSVLCIFEDNNGSIWIGTGGGGLNRYNPNSDSFTRFTEKEGLPSDVVYGILEDENNNLWLSSNFGLSRFSPAGLTFRNFTAGDGLQSNEFSRNAFAKDSKGFMYFGGINGLSIFLPSAIADNPAPPTVNIVSLTEEDEPISASQTPEYIQEIRLAWPRDSFEFEFSALDFSQPSKNQYAYKLEGFDADWNEIKSRRNGRYTNLPGGNYTLLLRATNSDGVWSPETARAIRVTVVTPFWETWQFQFFIIVALIAGAAYASRWRVGQAEKRAVELEHLVQKRTVDLEKRTTEIEALYKADEKIIRNVTINQVFQTLVDVSVSILKADRSVVFAWDEETHKIIPRVNHGFREETLYALKFEMGEGYIGQAMNSRDPIIIKDLHLANLRGDIRTVIQREGIQSFAHFPIAVDGKALAVFNVSYTRPNALNEDNIRLFTALAQRAAISIANMQLFEQTRDLAVMEERNRLARDLHDSAKQKAFAALAQLGTANGIFKSKPGDVKSHLKEAETLIYEVIQELTFLIQEIYPIALQEKGLAVMLREYIFEWENRNDATVNLIIENERRLPLDTEQAVYRVIQESLANISRHSQANRVEISLVYNPDSLKVSIADNGRGFDLDQKAKGVGLRSMRDRIGMARGVIQFQSSPGEGTRVSAQIPIKAGSGGSS